MRRTLLALALAGVALVTTTPAGAAPVRFERRCTGAFDRMCYYQFCGIASCTTTDCVVFLDPAQGYNTGTCLGPRRPDPGTES
ncbi:MAG TPA: hypothetical protein VGX28_03475 [Frankiaceae bacterium]|jgi:hypothetical protein|nr:hypothetical protein [Frankiaceae bacterium]